MPERIRMGVMGCASFAERSAIPTVLELPQLFELKCVASRSGDKAAEFAHKFQCEPVTGYQPLCDRDDLDLIYVPLPTGLHEEWVQKCLHSNKHVFVEKSMADSYDSAKSMLQVARNKNLLLAENFMFQTHRQMKVVQELIAGDEIGQLRQLRSSFGFPPLDPTNFRFDASLGGGALLDAGAYTLKAAQFFLGQNLELLSAHLADTMDCGVDTNGSAHLVNPDQITAQLSFGFDHFYQCNFELWGSKGKLTATRAFTAKPDFSPEIIVERQGEKRVHPVPPDHQFKNLFEQLHHRILKKDFESFWHEADSQARLIDSVKATAAK